VLTLLSPVSKPTEGGGSKTEVEREGTGFKISKSKFWQYQRSGDLCYCEIQELPTLSGFLMSTEYEK